jgi:hypothetical protein
MFLARRSARRQTYRIAYMCRSRKCAGERHRPRSPLGLKDLVADADASIGEIRLCLI